jgi:hypothetical protein
MKWGDRSLGPGKTVMRAEGELWDGFTWEEGSGSELDFIISHCKQISVKEAE